jgi:tetratricopeptide (TPR) repeat protein
MKPDAGPSERPTVRWSSDLPYLTPRRVRARLTAWYLRRLGERWEARDPAKAEALYRQAAATIEHATDSQFPELLIPLIRIGEAERRRGDTDAAEESFRRAVAISRKAFGGHDVRTAWAESKLAAVLTDRGSYDQADALLRPALEIYQRTLGRSHAEVAYILDLLGQNLRKSGHLDEAEACLTRSLAIRKRRRNREAWSWTSRELAITLAIRAVHVTDQGMLEQADRLYEKARDLLTAAVGPRHWMTASLIGEIAWMRRRQGDYREAESLYREQRQIYIESGEDVDHITGSSVSLAGVLADEARFDEARELLNNALELWEPEAESASKSKGIATLLHLLSRLELRLANFTSAEQLAKRGLTLTQEQEPGVLDFLTSQADALDGQGRCQEAYDLQISVLTAARKYGSDRETDALYQLGIFDRGHEGLADEGRAALREALANQERKVGPTNPSVAWTVIGLAGFDEGDQPTEAASLYERAIGILQSAYGLDYPDAAEAITDLAGLRVHQGKREDAKRLLGHARRVTELTFGPDHPQLAYVLNGLGHLHAHAGSIKAAVEDWRRSVAITEASLGPNHPDMIACFDYWEEGLREAGQSEEADRVKLSADRIRIRHLSLKPAATVLRTIEGR